MSMDDLWGYAIVSWISLWVVVAAFWAVVEIVKQIP